MTVVVRERGWLWFAVASFCGVVAALLWPIRSKQGLWSVSVDGERHKTVRVRGANYAAPIRFLLEGVARDETTLRSNVDTRLSYAIVALTLGTVSGVRHVGRHRHSA
jgi:hypothetical protein